MFKTVFDRVNGLTIYVCLSETGSHVAQASFKCSMYPDGGLKFLVLLPLPPKSQNYQCVSPCPGLMWCWGSKPGLYPCQANNLPAESQSHPNKGILSTSCK